MATASKAEVTDGEKEDDWTPEMGYLCIHCLRVTPANHEPFGNVVEGRPDECVHYEVCGGWAMDLYPNTPGIRDYFGASNE